MRISDWSSDVCSSDLYAFNKATNHVDAYVGRATILATGGAGRTYIFSTAPRGATGDGIAMAWRAGCRVSNMEMNRSEEHTSELQSLMRNSYAVFGLKQNTTTPQNNHRQQDLTTHTL